MIVLGEPLHLLRQFGVNTKDLDLLDEKLLTHDQIRQVCSVILGGTPEDYPNPTTEIPAFIKVVDERSSNTPLVSITIYSCNRCICIYCLYYYLLDLEPCN